MIAEQISDAGRAGFTEEHPLEVIKIGGSLLRDQDDLLRRAGAIAARHRTGPLLVVVSALHGVTDALERIALCCAVAGDDTALAADLIEGLERRHLDIAAALPEDDRPAVAPLFAELRAFLERRRPDGLGEADFARVMSFGERLAAPLVAAAIRAAGVAARAVDSEEAGLRGVGRFESGRLDLAGCRIPPALLRELRERVLVLTGFYGLTARREVVLFGRGGSDYTAGALSALLGAASLELWKDVPGFMSADPRAVPAARWVPLLSFTEVGALGRLGARMLHRECLEPLRGRATTVRVGLCDGRTTRIVERRDRGVGVVAVAGRPRQNLVRLHRSEIAGGWTTVRELIASLHGSAVAMRDVKSTSNSLCFSIPPGCLEMVRKILRRHPSRAKERLEVLDRPAEIGLVGEGVGRDRRIAGRLLHCLAAFGTGGSPLRRSTTGADLRSVLSDDDHHPALMALHESFIGAPATACNA